MKKLLLLAVFSLLAIAPLVAVGAPQPAQAVVTGDAAADKCEMRFLTFPTWFRGLSQIDDNGQCGVISPSDPSLATDEDGRFSAFIWRIVLNIIEIALQVVGYIAFFFIIYGGFQFMTGGSEPGQIEKARQTLLNAVIGLAISIASIGLVNLVFGIIG